MENFNVYETVKKQKEEEKKSNSFNGVLDQIRIDAVRLKTPEMIERYKSLMESSNQLMSDYRSRFFDEEGNYIPSFRKDSEDVLKKYTSAKEKHDSEAKQLKNFFDTYGKYLDSKTVSDITSSLDLSRKGLNDMFTAYQSDHETMSKYKDEDDYNQKVVIPQQEYEAQKSADLGALKSEIDNIELYIKLKSDRASRYAELVTYYINEEGYLRSEAERRAKDHEDIIEFDKQITTCLFKADDPIKMNDSSYLSERKRFYNNATRIQEGIALKENAINDEDFDKYSKMGSDMEESDLSEHPLLDIGYSMYELYNYMEENEFNIYNYYLAKEGKDKE